MRSSISPGAWLWVSSKFDMRKAASASDAGCATTIMGREVSVCPIGARATTMSAATAAAKILALIVMVGGFAPEGPFPPTPVGDPQGASRGRPSGSFGSVLEGPGHVLGTDPLVEIGGVDITQLGGRLLQGLVLAIGLERYRGRSLVTDVGVESRDEHQGIVEVLLDHLPVGFDPHRGEVVERPA